MGCVGGLLASQEIKVGSVRAALSLFRPLFDSSPCERLAVAFVDARTLLVALSTFEGTTFEVLAETRTIFEEALDVGAAGLLLAHNHPSGEVLPSQADRRSTRRISTIGRMLQLTIVDHLIFAGDQWSSFRMCGFL